jgi:hypothetical protein
MLSAEDLLAGAAVTFDVELPAKLLAGAGERVAASVRLRPLTIHDLHVIARAARDNETLASVLMVKTALVEPELTLAQANALPAGLLQHLLAEVNRVSGLELEPEVAEQAAEEPLVRAAFLLSQQFGWTPREVSELTLGQILVHLQLLEQQAGSA